MTLPPLVYAATELLKNMVADMATCSGQEFEMSDFTSVGDLDGVAATVTCPTGERFRVTVEHINNTEH